MDTIKCIQSNLSELRKKYFIYDYKILYILNSDASVLLDLLKKDGLSSIADTVIDLACYYEICYEDIKVLYDHLLVLCDSEGITKSSKLEYFIQDLNNFIYEPPAW